MVLLAAIHEHPYGIQFLTLWLAIIPIVLLTVLLIGAILRSQYRHRHSRHPEEMERLLHK